MFDAECKESIPFSAEFIEFGMESKFPETLA